MSEYERVRHELSQQPQRWTVTGAAGFIGSHLVETLLGLGQVVVGLDDFSNGSKRNLEDVRAAVGADASKRFEFIEGDICDVDTCKRACEGSTILLHEAALGSIPRSIAHPERSTAVNVGGFVNVLVAARDTGIRRVVYASSSSVYGDNPDLPKVEARTGTPLSPYAATKVANELFAGIFRTVFEMEILGLRYFNVFGPRQDPKGAYAAVIPRWIDAIRDGAECTLFGDGSSSRDFSFVADVVQANLLAATTTDPAALGEIFNVGAGGRTSLNELYALIYSGVRSIVGEETELAAGATPLYADARPGETRHSQADVSKARDVLGFEISHSVADGLQATLDWFFAKSA